ncbi:MAG: response regulator transcription factor [Deferribacteres bacterium]|nr:response regulator transcription factor [candidate division KSB1 bacterium]MCB9509457.1 response regulator transcription factor [Deferribacteres bacterium]
MNQKIKILLADDHPIVRNGISASLQSIDQFEIVGEAENGLKAVEMTTDLRPDVVIVDISMPEMCGISATKVIREKNPKTKVLVLTMHDEEQYMVQMLAAGANGYLAKNSSKDELVSAIHAICSNDVFYSPLISEDIIQRYIDALESQQDEEDDIPLTNREKEILELISESLTTKEISAKLFISHRTVDTHRTNLMRKLNIRNTAGLVRFAIQKGLVQLD